jgi:small GTP-binding protein domain
MKTNQLVVGIFAHVDAGKTTLAESILYSTGAIQKAGRVDHKDAFLDTHELERERGITIFSKQAKFSMGTITVTLMDTPGHVDFSAETERTLQVLDYAILVINGMDGVQGHTVTLWELLKHHNIPVFVFINKMDQEGADKEELLAEIQTRLDANCLDFCEKEDVLRENLAMCSESVMEQYLESGKIETKDVRELIESRQAFPCYFGSALKMEGVDAFLAGLEEYMQEKPYADEFGAKVYKVSRDEQGNRLTHMKVTGGSLKVKQLLCGEHARGGKWEEKVEQIRIYSGERYEVKQEVLAGTLCCVTGLGRTYAGERLGAETVSAEPILAPVLQYEVCFPSHCDVHEMYMKVRILEEEEPQLHVIWEEKNRKIYMQVMGEIQVEILKSIILERFGVAVTFAEGNIVYKETIQELVEGVGHFEPLRHYAEVHVLLEPMENGSGISYAVDCSEDILDKNWQRLVLGHLKEKKHRGVLTGSDITDVKITLVSGRAHNKHTEGGDFRQATYRAVRQGLRRAKSILLEPVYDYRLEVPMDKVGRALSDIQKMAGTFSEPHMNGEVAVITGNAPVFNMRNYQMEVIAYTRGEGKFSCTLGGYEPCHNTEAIIEQIGYDAEADVENPTGSVFCSQGSGFTVKWDEVEQYMHVENRREYQAMKSDVERKPAVAKASVVSDKSIYDDKELEAIFVKTYGEMDKRRMFESQSPRPKVKREKEVVYKKKEVRKQYLLVDGYNIIFAWTKLKELAEVDIAAARDKLCEILCNYQGYKQNILILVFDAYKVPGYKGEITKYKNISVVYTKEAQTADQYIEKTVQKMNGKADVTVATSDAMEQMIVWGWGAMRLSAEGLYKEIEVVNKEIHEKYLKKEQKLLNRPIQL